MVVKRVKREKKYKHYPIIEDKSTKAHEEWEPWVHKGLWAIKGYQMVRGPSGGGTVEEALKREPKDFMVIDRASAALYSHSYGLVSPFFKGLLDGELKGTKCPVCGTVYCPPRAHCWNPKCAVAETEWLDLPLKGVIHTFTIQCLAASPFASMLPFSMGYVMVDGADTTLPMFLHIDPKGIFIGQKVEIKFAPKEKRKGELMDLYAVAVPGQKIPEWSCLHKNPKDLEMLQEFMNKTLEWVKKRYGIDNSPEVRGW